MKHRKLRKDNKLYIGLFYTLNGILAALFAAMGLFSVYLHVLAGSLALVILMNILFTVRTGNYWFLITALHYLVLSAALWVEMHSNGSNKQTFLIMFIFTFILVMYTGITRRVKWRREEILELAAQPVETSFDGFTERPYPSGHIPFDEHTMRRFLKFTRKNLIGVPYFEENRFVLALPGRPMDHILGIRRDYTMDTWIAFDRDGGISVSIHKDDYLHYEEELTFDLLSKSMGDLFSEFFRWFRKGEESRIIHRLNALGLMSFTGGLIGF